MIKTKGRISVVDDEEDIIFILSEFLKKEGYTVMTSQTGKNAIEKIKEGIIPDLVLLDIALPNMNGIEVLREIKRIDKNIPVIMITAYRDAEKVVECFRLGAYDCIFKPFDFRYLKRTMLAKLLY